MQQTNLVDKVTKNNAANKVTTNESDFNYDSKFSSRGFKKFQRMSLGSKYDEINDPYTFLMHLLIHTK